MRRRNSITKLNLAGPKRVQLKLATHHGSSLVLPKIEAGATVRMNNASVMRIRAGAFNNFTHMSSTRAAAYPRRHMTKREDCDGRPHATPRHHPQHLHLERGEMSFAIETEDAQRDACRRRGCTPRHNVNHRQRRLKTKLGPSLRLCVVSQTCPAMDEINANKANNANL